MNTVLGACFGRSLTPHFAGFQSISARLVGIHVLLLASFALREKAVVVLGNVVLDTPVAVGLTTMWAELHAVEVNAIALRIILNALIGHHDNGLFETWKQLLADSLLDSCNLNIQQVPTIAQVMEAARAGEQDVFIFFLDKLVTKGWIDGSDFRHQQRGSDV